MNKCACGTLNTKDFQKDEKFANDRFTVTLIKSVLQNTIQRGTLQIDRRIWTMAVKTANVTARIQPEIKEHAEAILEKLGIPVSVFIDMAYRQVIMRDGVPFSLEIPSTLTTRDALSKEEFDTIMQTGLAQAKADDSLAMDDAFNQLKAEI